MKLTLLLTALFSINAQASFYQIDCTDAHGHLTKHNGHHKNGIIAKKYQKRSTKKIEVPIDRQLVNVDVLDTSEFETITKSSCDHPGQKGKGGFISQTKHYYQKIEITKKDGSDFDKALFNVSEDGKSLKAHLICTSHFNSRTLCQ